MYIINKAAEDRDRLNFQATIHVQSGRTSTNSPNCPDPDSDPGVRESEWTQCAKRCKIPHFSLTERTYLTQNAPYHEPIATGSHEVSGSIPLISTKTKSHSVRNGFLFWLSIRGARTAVVRPNAFLRRKSAAFSACNAENIRKCNRHGASEACGVSRLSFHFPFSKIGRISLVMRPDPDLTQTGAKTRWIY